MSHFISKLLSVFRVHPKKSLALILTIIAGIALFSVLHDTADAPETEVEVEPRSVELVSVSALSQNSEPIVVVGEVRSVSQAELRAEKTGQVTGVYVRAGQFVKAGTLLAEIENAQERASVASAEAGLKSAEAQLAKVRAGARTEDRVSVEAQREGARNALTTAEESARNAYQQSYSIAYNAVFVDADRFFTDSYTVRPSFRVRSALYDERVALEAERVLLGELLETWGEQTTTPPSSENLDARLVEARIAIERIKLFIQTISTYVSKQEVDTVYSATQKASDEGALFASRNTLDSGRSALLQTQNALTGARTNLRVLEQTETAVTSGARVEDVALAEAGVMQAQSGLRSAQAILAKSLIRSPIDGTLGTFSVSKGDFVNGQQVLGVVANENAREIEVFVSDAVRARIAVGDNAIVRGAYEGVISNVASGLDPVSKKARVLIRISDEAELVQGAYIEVAFLPQQTDTTTATSLGTTGFSIPLSALKVTPTGLVVFTVSEEGTLEALPVQEGPISGTRMEVREGLTPETRIVRDVRGLTEGEPVTLRDESLVPNTGE
jgi:multidrug efflux pump subunit AcrA (membrane-fusion protein)